MLSLLTNYLFPVPKLENIQSTASPSINYHDPYFLASILFAFLNPIAWNVLGRLEYRTGGLSAMFSGSKERACYAFAAFIFGLGLVRDHVFQVAVSRQAASHLLSDLPLVDPVAWLCLAVGSLLVGTSMWKLGVTGTYLGDHFGILKRERITSFPFSVAEHPMYYGATLCFLSHALRMKSPAGLFLTGVVALSYGIAAQYEGKFTAQIYAKAQKNKRL